jgi:hypothetical protein
MEQQQERDRLSAGELWQEHGLVFASRVGTPQHRVRSREAA